MGDPCVLIGNIPASNVGNRELREHEAGIHLLNYGMLSLGYPEYKIRYEKSGKPYFESEGTRVPVYFSISHSGDYAVCAISRHVIGCDIEKIKSVPHILDKELRKIRNTGFRPVSDDHNTIRVQQWTVYESIGKYFGSGIPVELEWINRQNWKVYSWVIASQYVLTVVQRKR